MLCRRELCPICNFPQMYGYHSQLVELLFDGLWREILPTFLPTSFFFFCLKMYCKIYVFHWKTTELTVEEIQVDSEKVMCLGHMIA